MTLILKAKVIAAVTAAMVVADRAPQPLLGSDRLGQKRPLVVSGQVVATADAPWRRDHGRHLGRQDGRRFDMASLYGSGGAKMGIL